MESARSQRKTPAMKILHNMKEMKPMKSRLVAERKSHGLLMVDGGWMRADAGNSRR